MNTTQVENTQVKIDYVSLLQNDSYFEGARCRMKKRLEHIRKKENEACIQISQNTNSNN